MNTERLKQIEALELKSGSHKEFEDGACIMEMVSYINNEPWSDHPQCACPILTEYAIRLNDRFSHEHRQLMKPFIPLLVGTKLNDETQIARKKLLMWRNVTATYPLILDLFKLDDIASELRTFQNTLSDMAKAKKLLVDNKDKIYKSAYANAYINANTYAYAYADAYAYANANAYSSADAYADTYPSASANAYSSAYAYANAYACSSAYSDADADAYAYANAYADASANALREELVAKALETLQMAIDIKIGTAPQPAPKGGT